MSSSISVVQFGGKLLTASSGNSKFFSISACALWYVSSLQLHKDLEVPILAEHIRNLAQNFESKITDSSDLAKLGNISPTQGKSINTRVS